MPALLQVLTRPRVSLAPMIALAAAACLLLPSAALAVIHPANVLDGPANDIVDVDGTAMAPDGSGGIVYRKDLGGVIHIFAAQFINGRWGAPVQVDTADPYGASMPAIAAGDGGRLLVVWVQARNVNSQGTTLFELVGASLQPGAGSFGQAVVIDANVGEPFTGDDSAVDPALAMNPSSGQAYVVYRVITNDCNTVIGDPPTAACPAGNSTSKLVDVRVARFNYLTWSSLGAINRAPQIPMRNPTPSNAPSIGIDLNGNGVVAWQEPGDDGVARIWVRRLFGVVLGNVLQASPETIGSRPLSSDAEAPAVAMGPYGEARIAYLIDGAPGSVVPTTRLYVNSISSELGLKAAQLTGAVSLADAGSGTPSVAIDSRGDYRLAFTRAGAVQELAGSDESVGSPVVVGSSEAQAAPTAISPAGGGTTAWTTAAGGASVVDVREDFARGAFQLAQLAGAIAGSVSGLACGGSGQGDALLGWMQGATGQSEVVGDFIQAPPAPFNVTVSSNWVRAASAAVAWEASPDAVAGVTYTVYVDGKARVRGLSGLATHLSSAGLGDGVHHVQVLASDNSGQQTMSSEHVLKIDANPPTVRVRVIDGQRGVRVTVRDSASGVEARKTLIAFGDDQHAKGRATVSHEYRRAGLYTIRAQVQDKVGNHATVELRVRVR
jgi:hypothetical protein